MKRIYLIILVLVAVVGGCTYVNQNNTMVELEEEVQGAWAQVQNQYQRRADLIPNLEATVRGAVDAEKDILTQIADARARATQITLDKDIIKDPEAMAKLEESNAQISNIFSRLLMVQEQYPELKSNQQFTNMMAELSGTENRISQERRKYNEEVKEYNSYIRKFPASVVAGMAGFDKVAYFQAEGGAEQAPTVNFSN